MLVINPKAIPKNISGISNIPAKFSNETLSAFPTIYNETLATTNKI